MPCDIDELRRRYAAVPPDGPAAARAAGALGRGLALRYLRDGGGAEDRDDAIGLLDEALGVPHRDATVTHVVLGVLLFFRVVPIQPGGGGDPTGAQAFAVFWTLMTGQADTPARRGDRDRVRAHMRWVSEHEPADAPVRAAAEAMVVALDLFSGSVPGPEALIRLAGVAEMFEPSMGELVQLLNVATKDAPAYQESLALDAVFRQLPVGHRLRPAILAEAGVLLAHGQLTDLPAALTGLLPALRETIEQLPAGGPLRDATIRQLAGLLVSVSAQTGDAAGTAQAVQLADDLVARDGDGRDRFLRALALTLRGRTAGDDAALRAAATDLTAALAGLPPGDELRPVVAAMLGVLLNDRYLVPGQRADAEAGDALLTAARPALDPAGTDRTVIALAGLMSRTVLAVRHGDSAVLGRVIDEVEEGLAMVDERYPWRSRLDVGLGLAFIMRGAPGDLRRGVERLRRADADLAVEASGRPALRAVAALAGLLDGDPGDPSVAARIDEAAHDPAAPEPDRAVLALAGAHVALLRSMHGPADPAEAVARFEQARTGPIAARPGHPLAMHLHDGLARAYDLVGRRADAVAAGLDALRAHGDNVLLQTGTGPGLDAARQASALARQVAEWAIAEALPEQALEAVELGRGILVHGALVGSTVPALLRAAGRNELAAEWETAPEPEVRVSAGVEQLIGTLVVPSDLRPRVLAALHAAGVEPLSAAPDRARIGEVVRATESDALVYLLAGAGAGGGAGDRPGYLIVVAADGTLTVLEADRLRLDLALDDLALHDLAGRAEREAEELTGHRPADEAEPTDGGPGRRSRLNAVCDWAWTALIEPLLALPRPPRRVILVPVGGLGVVPWHAARSGARYACAEFTLSYAAAARQLSAVVRRARPDGSLVVVADPTQGSAGASSEVEWLCEGPYPDAVVLGTPEETLDVLMGEQAPAVLHLACHAVTGSTPEQSRILLAGSRELPVAAILAAARDRSAEAPGGLVVLSGCVTDLTTSAYDEALSLASAFLAAGPVGVIASRWPVGDHATVLLTALVHHFRTTGGMPGREALHAAQRWMLDPAAEVPGELTAICPRRPRWLTEPAIWASVAFHGR